ncbi:folate-binding protein [Candidimonas humi]|uniref:YgfZ/GcvT domain-containing protein n=1 Tax=Candidimonas humi TaxID=683355 RepID=A0ABV8NRK9_9BURK|nr:folate-binding protein [Candidimonas humi]MBV6303583.1 folate-binding protein [Candidimonas humi]
MSADLISSAANPAGAASPVPYFCARLRDLALIEIAGADAVSFMHGQLTQDVAGLPAGQAALAGYCTPKGRLLATMVLWHAPAGTEAPALYALVKADIAQALVKRLSMYVLRAKAKLRLLDAPIAGLAPRTDDNPLPLPDAGSTRQAALPPGAALAELPADPQAWTLVSTGAGVFIAAPKAPGCGPRWWWIGAAAAPGGADANRAQGEAAADDGTTADTGTDAQAEAWRALDIAAGLPWVSAATQDLFIPQTLNLDLIGGVNFTKGCYPGQEIVARSHYRGTVKRRMAGGVIDAAIPAAAQLAGRDTYDAGRPDSPSGRVIDAAASAGKTMLLMEVQLGDLAGAAYRLGAADGPEIALQALPYEISPAAQADA